MSGARANTSRSPSGLGKNESRETGGHVTRPRRVELCLSLEPLAIRQRRELSQARVLRASKWLQEPFKYQTRDDDPRRARGDMAGRAGTRRAEGAWSLR